MLNDWSDKSYDESKIVNPERIFYTCLPQVELSSDVSYNYAWGGSRSLRMSDYACQYATENLTQRNFILDTVIHNLDGTHNYKIEFSNINYVIKRTRHSAKDKFDKSHTVPTSHHTCAVVFTLVNIRTGIRKEYREEIIQQSRAGKNLSGKKVIEKDKVYPSDFLARCIRRCIGEIAKDLNTN